MKLYSPLQYRSFAARLKRGIYDSFRIKWYTISFSWEKPVAGEVWTSVDDTVEFFIFKRRFAFNSFAPRLEGVISSDGIGTNIVAKFSFQHMLFETVVFPGLIIAAFLFSNEGYLLTIIQKNLYLFSIVTILLLIVAIINGINEVRFLSNFLVTFVEKTSKNVAS